MSRSIFNQKRKRLRTRRIIIVCVAVLLLFSLVFGIVLLCGGDDTEKDTSHRKDADSSPAIQQPTLPSFDLSPDSTDGDAAMQPVRVLPTDYLTRETKTPYIALYDLSAQTMLFSKGGDTPCAPASLTKLMTALVALQYVQPDTLLTAGDELGLKAPDAKRAGIAKGNQLTLTQALQGLLMESGSDAAYVIAAHVGHILDTKATGQAAVDRFCQEMTKMAKDLGCTNTVFLNPDGMDKDGHISTANDMLRISVAAHSHTVIAEIVATQEVKTTFHTGQTLTWDNGNRLLQTFPGANGLKTGYTSAAKNCIAVSATRDQRTVICIMLGAPSNDLLLNETTQLLNLSFP